MPPNRRLGLVVLLFCATIVSTLLCLLMLGLVDK